MGLFINEPFTSHSGKRLSFKIECDALTDVDIDTLAAIISQFGPFSDVYGVPRGGLRIAAALQQYRTRGPILIVDDVLTTGRSMEEARRLIGNDTVGVVLFCRGRCPAWVRPVFTFNGC